MATSSSTMWKSSARDRSASHTAFDTSSRLVSSDSALYCATTALTTSEPMEGSTRSSQSSPKFCTECVACRKLRIYATRYAAAMQTPAELDSNLCMIIRRLA